jgi:D-glycero-alpha-D-manno-heptose 1-phosphate guanylyltransferase
MAAASASNPACRPEGGPDPVGRPEEGAASAPQAGPGVLPEAIVLAGGFGTRLRSVVSELPKPMAPVGERPFLEIVLDELVNAGVQRCVLAVGYKRETIEAHFGKQYRGMALAYSIEDEPLGTGGGIRQAADMLDGDACLVLNGDTLFRVDLEQLSRRFAERQSLLCVALKEMRDFDRYGTVVLESDGTISGFREKQPMQRGLINGGVYALHKELFALKELPPVFSFEKEILEAEVGRRRFHGEAFDAYFIDIGIPEDYARAQVELV